MMTSRKAVLAAIFLALLWIAMWSPSALALPSDQQEAAPGVVTGQTVITVTVMLADSTMVTIPITLDISADASKPLTMSIHASAADAADVTYRVNIDSPVYLAGDTVTPDPLPVAAKQNANLRAGPGTDYPVAGNVVAGETLIVVGQAADGSWLLLDGGAWIAAFLVDGEIGDVPVMEPTATPTPRPTATQTPTATPDEAAGRAYMAELLPILQVYMKNLTTIGKNFTAAGYDVTLFFDQDWRTETALAITMIQFANAEVRKLNPPAQYAEGHAQLMIAADHFDRSMDLTVEAIDEFDPDKASLAGVEMTLAGEALNRATEILLPD